MIFKSRFTLFAVAASFAGTLCLSLIIVGTHFVILGFQPPKKLSASSLVHWDLTQPLKVNDLKSPSGAVAKPANVSSLSIRKRDLELNGVVQITLPNGSMSTESWTEAGILAGDNGRLKEIILLSPYDSCVNVKRLAERLCRAYGGSPTSIQQGSEYSIDSWFDAAAVKGRGGFVQPYGLSDEWFALDWPDRKGEGSVRLCCNPNDGDKSHPCCLIFDFSASK